MQKQTPAQALGHCGETWGGGLVAALCCDKDADLQRATAGAQHPGTLVRWPQALLLPGRREAKAELLAGCGIAGHAYSALGVGVGALPRGISVPAFLWWDAVCSWARQLPAGDLQQGLALERSWTGAEGLAMDEGLSKALEPVQEVGEVAVTDPGVVRQPHTHQFVVGIEEPRGQVGQAVVVQHQGGEEGQPSQQPRWQAGEVVVAQP